MDLVSARDRKRTRRGVDCAKALDVLLSTYCPGAFLPERAVFLLRYAFNQTHNFLSELILEPPSAATLLTKRSLHNVLQVIVQYTGHHYLLREPILREQIRHAG